MSVKGKLAPDAAIGMASGVPTNVPSGRCVSMNTAVEAVVRAAAPVPTRTTEKAGEQVPVALQKRPEPWLQAVPAGALGFDGAPAVQTSCVHWLPSFGRSLLSAAVAIPPEPSHTLDWQSPGVCAAIGVPAATLLKPQVLFVQLRTRHSVSWPGQLLAITHCTHRLAPLHTPVLQAIPAARGGFDGAPFVQTSLVQSLPSTGTSTLSIAGTTLP